ncbi:hypothetical protein NC651_027324 [Populus alba x Populus x berolinensis]|nr:hypothetical protein NC651_027324 [Populus alba x Populus x berolinensis]
MAVIFYLDFNVIIRIKRRKNLIKESFVLYQNVVVRTHSMIHPHSSLLSDCQNWFVSA